MPHRNLSAAARPRKAILAGAACAMFMISAVAVRPARADDAQKVFSTPEAAAAALDDAAKTADASEALQILGPGAKKVISSGDPVADRNAAAGFATGYDRMHRLAFDSKGRVILYLGAENWPFPIPIVKKGDGWVFDTAAGEKEILYRRIGTNELFTIATLRQLVAAQDEYKNEATGGGGQFARKVLSSSGSHDGLYWPAVAGEPPSPIGPLVASATDEGYHAGGTPDKPTPFHGYVYRILTSQGKDAPGGAKDYVADGKLTGGFAFIAYPAEYRSSGVMTFLVNQDGTILQKDLGKDTDALAKSMTDYDPDSSWVEVTEYSA
ncbi:MAG: DUF2950 domain-containing protein [Candidatus Binataceae bacterium]